MTRTRHRERAGTGTRSVTGAGPRSGSDGPPEHGDGRCGDVDDGLFAGLCQMPSHEEIRSLIAVTATANLALANRRTVDQRRAHRGAGPADRRSH